MKVQLQRGRMVIEPDGPPDELYLEQVLGIRGHGCAVTFHPPAKNAPAGTWGAVTLQAAKAPEPPPEAPVS